jgi:hypothetical protein
MRNMKIPVAEYKSFAPEFTAAKYDPVAWAKLAKAAAKVPEPPPSTPKKGKK